ncbi:MAG TPA: methionyl-tRNA formyltransferase [Candidatus Dormibacteraeota bacterium]|nr:methionyl-tRNA formyltransferase [Candidatus Dormibacteraeota bacterium]
MRYRVAFFGTPEFAVPTLQALIDGPDEVVGVVCQPDRPAGRGQKLQAPPVKQLAQECGLHVAQPVKLKSDEFPAALAAWRSDLAVVAAYGRILPPRVLETPHLGCINVHASLLPAYRGAAPIQWAILNGDDETGVTIMRMNERMDEGDILLQRATPIGSDETYGALQTRLAMLGAAALMKTLDDLYAGTLKATAQDHSRATLAPMIRKEQGAIDWRLPAVVLARRVRGFNPWPSAYTTLRDKLLKIHIAHAERGGGEAGRVVDVGDRIRVATGDGVLAIETLQLAGRKPLPARDFARGGGLAVGERLGAATAAG